MVLIFIKLLCELLFDFVDLLNLCGRGTDTVSVGLGKGLCRWVTLNEERRSV